MVWSAMDIALHHPENRGVRDNRVKGGQLFILVYNQIDTAHAVKLKINNELRKVNHLFVNESNLELNTRENLFY